MIILKDRMIIIFTSIISYIQFGSLLDIIKANETVHKYTVLPSKGVEEFVWI